MMTIECDATEAQGEAEHEFAQRAYGVEDAQDLQLEMLCEDIFSLISQVHLPSNPNTAVMAFASGRRVQCQTVVMWCGFPTQQCAGEAVTSQLAIGQAL